MTPRSTGIFTDSRACEHETSPSPPGNLARNGMSYRISSVSSITGIKMSTLRAWERRYGVTQPRRTEGGYRLYSEEDVARLVRIKHLLGKGFKVSEAAALVRKDVPELESPGESDVDLREARESLLAALLRMDRAEAGRLAAGLATTPASGQIEKVYLPMMREVGVLWESGKATICEEHFLSNFVRERLGEMVAALDAGSTNAPEAVLAGPPGERHEIGLLGIAACLAERGWRVTYLGPDVPVDSLQELVRQRPPALVCTSMVRPNGEMDWRRFVAAIGEMSRSGPPVLIGGAAAEQQAESIAEHENLFRASSFSEALPLIERLEKAPV